MERWVETTISRKMNLLGTEFPGFATESSCIETSHCHWQWMRTSPTSLRFICTEQTKKDSELILWSYESARVTNPEALNSFSGSLLKRRGRLSHTIVPSLMYTWTQVQPQCRNTSMRLLHRRQRCESRVTRITWPHPLMFTIGVISQFPWRLRLKLLMRWQFGFQDSRKQRIIRRIEVEEWRSC